MTITFTAMPTQDATHLWAGGSDAYGQHPQERISDGEGYPCRHCLEEIADGDEVLVFAYCPFPELQPYAETGPILLHKEPCRRYEPSAILPPMLTSADYIVRGYDRHDCIVYGTGAVTTTKDISDYAERLLARDDVAYVHVRSARNNCFQCRIDP